MATTRVVVHVGPVKTGTTALGSYFSTAHVTGILPQNVVYPVGDLWFPASGEITKHPQLADFLYPEGRQNSGRKTAIQTPDSVAEKVRQIAAHVAKLPGSIGTAVFICEMPEDRPHLDRLLDLLISTFDEVVLVLAVRSPVEASQSLLVHRIKEWRSDQVDFDLLGMLTTNEGLLSFDYRRLISRLHNVAIKELVLMPYFEAESDGYAVVDRFMKVVTGDTATRLDGDFGSRRIHPSLPLSSLKRLVGLKKLKSQLRRIPFLESIIHSLFRRILNADRDKVMRAGFNTRSTDSGDWVVSPEQRARILSLYGNLGDVIRQELGKQAAQAEWRAWFKATGF